MSKKVIFLDAGHGGCTPRGRYTTAPSKMFKHRTGNFHKGTLFYEGVKNREYCSLLHEILVSKGITVIPVYHEYKDTSLSKRVNVANYYHKHIAKGIYISEHSNATPQHTARGFSIWTSPGKTKSDVYAEMFINMYQDKFSHDSWGVPADKKIRTLVNLKDGDKDYEARFYVLVNTDMPAILLENLFFDNLLDANLLMLESYRRSYVELQAAWIEQIVS